MRQFVSAFCRQSGGIATSEAKLARPPRRNERQQEHVRRHASRCSVTQLAVKPGPMAVSNVRDAKPS
jgi:hypothetical protein